MKTKNTVSMVVLVLVWLLAACGGNAPQADAMPDTPTESVMMDKPTEEAMQPHETPTPDAMPVKPTEGAMLETPAWFGATLTNVNTGEAFTLNELNGKVILVETMAVWCPNCKRQQEQVKALHALLGERDDFVSLGLDIDPNESADVLKNYVTSNGFDWLYAVPAPEINREIAALYGDQLLNPPSTPMLIIDHKGTAHPLPFGVKSAEELLEMLKPFLDEAM
jgi:cytochrome oxidase Cu insertion factor (SCO1/SenC/PrrC family)